jgi:hypothetical protein
MTKRIICLANSNKDLCHNSGRCIAGKDVSVNNFWIRPISARPTEEISFRERLYENGQEPKILDMIDIEIIENRPNTFQTENHLIDDSYYWVKSGTYSTDELDQLLDNPDSLWTNTVSSYNGSNDRIPESLTSGISNSLYFIRATIQIVVETEGQHFNNPKKKVRCRFRYKGTDYKIPVTDPIIKDQYIVENDGYYEMGDKYMCISLGLCYSYDGNSPRYAYLFAAAII